MSKSKPMHRLINPKTKLKVCKLCGDTLNYFATKRLFCKRCRAAQGIYPHYKKGYVFKRSV